MYQLMFVCWSAGHLVRLWDNHLPFIFIVYDTKSTILVDTRNIGKK